MKNAKSKKESKKVVDLQVNYEIVSPPEEQALINTGRKVYYNNFEVRPAGNESEVYSPNTYSKHMERWKAYQEGKLTGPAAIYGLPQALDHITELRKNEELKDIAFEVVEVTIIKTIYKTTKI